MCDYIVFGIGIAVIAWGVVCAGIFAKEVFWGE